jgi:hypothetical protein
VAKLSVGCGLGAYMGYVAGWKNAPRPVPDQGYIDFYGGPGVGAGVGIPLGLISLDVSGVTSKSRSLTGGSLGTSVTIGTPKAFELPPSAAQSIKEISRALSGISAGASFAGLIPGTRSTFHTGADGLPTPNDAEVFKAYIRIQLTDATLRPLAVAMESVINYNRDAYEEARAVRRAR